MGSQRQAVVYSRAGCHLCEQLIEELLPLVRGRWQVEVIDIDANADLVSDYNDRVPVLEVDGNVVCQWRLDRSAVDRILLAESAADGASPQA